jgi:hypothetical protein
MIISYTCDLHFELQILGLMNKKSTKWLKIIIIFLTSPKIGPTMINNLDFYLRIIKKK